MHQTIVLTNLCPIITKINFSDASSGQYKNCKHFYNLCQHAEAVVVCCCIWNFFPTSHGKLPCDGIGGTVKRLVPTASLQSSTTGQILSAQVMLEYCQKLISGIKFVYVTAEEMMLTQKKLAYRFSIATTMTGTRSLHQYTPSSTLIIKMKRVSEDDDFALTFDLVNKLKNELVQIDCYNITIPIVQI